jgi:predicted transcriptional regulator
MADKTSHEKMTHEAANERILGLATQILAAYASHNNVSAAELPALLGTMYQSMTRIVSGNGVTESRPEPAVSVRKSVTPEHIICLEDGKKLKMLKRHLKTAYNMTPDQYRERWGLGADYPMVAPNYAKQRSKLAKQIGLGTARRTGGKQKAA